MSDPRAPAGPASPPQANGNAVIGDSRRYWRSLDEVTGTPEFETFLHREFPEQADEPPHGFDRRRWLQVMGASFALAGVTGCRWEAEQLMPMAVRSAGRLPGIPQQFATAWELDGVGRGLLVTCVDGRPVKVEGNPDAPGTGGGASSAYDQSLVLSLYDPDRMGPVVTGKGPKAGASTLDGAVAALKAAVSENAGGTRVLCGVTSSPTLKRLRDEVVAAGAGWVEYSPLAKESLREGTRAAFGRPLRQVVDLGEPDVILCLDADPLGDDPANLSNLKSWSARRRPEDGGMNRLYAVESQFSTTGASADHRLPLKSTAIPAFLAKLEAAVDGGLSEKAAAADPFLAAVVDDLRGDKSKLVLCGSRQPAAVQARVHALNEKLGAVGLSFLEDPDPQRPDGTAAIAALAGEMRAGRVETLLILGGNPAYDAPADVRFAEGLAKVENSCHVAEYRDETSLLCGWHVPAAHPLESWGDVRLHDGTLAVQQPLIEPLHGGVTAAEVLARVLGRGATAAYEIARETFEAVAGGGTGGWKKAVHAGFAEGTAAAPAEAAVGDVAAPRAVKSDGFELVLTPSSTVHDGRFANLGWLQECPDFLTKLVWDNAALIAPEDAAELGIAQGEGVTIAAPGGAAIDVPAYVLAGQARGSIGLALGYGRTAAGIVGGNVGIKDAGWNWSETEEEVVPVGFDAYPLRSSQTPEVVPGVTLAKGGLVHELVTTQNHHAIDEQGMEQMVERVPVLVREATERQFAEHPTFADEMVHHPPLKSLWQAREYTGHAWGMAIDLSKCVGCNACVVACQAENNVPVVGKDQVAKGREMHWLRMDRYFTPNVRDEDAIAAGDATGPGDDAFGPYGAADVTDPAAWANPAVASQPLMCVHCENAPCEQVCPVAATVHSDEGLNSMVYNRCIGTRYCSNNCPYKVRRFNFLNYNKRYEGANKELSGLVLNPEVTVRSRGVMEKCTYCTQRIQHVKIEAQNANRPIKDGEIRPACGQACPTDAIVFGDLHDEDSEVRRLHENGRAYKLLSELNVKPRTAYLARIRNAHPLLELREAYYRELQLHAGHGGGHGDEHGDGGQHGGHDTDHRAEGFEGRPTDHADGHNDAGHGHDAHDSDDHGHAGGPRARASRLLTILPA